jgi:hypothetical protein
MMIPSSPLVTQCEAIIEAASIPRQFDDADIEAAEIMGVMLREGQSLAVQRKIADRLRAFRIANDVVLGAMGVGA